MYVEGWPSTTSAWAGQSRFDISVNRYGGVLYCTFSATVAQQNTGVPYLPLGQPAGKYLLSKISKSGQGQQSVYSVFILLAVLYRAPTYITYIFTYKPLLDTDRRSSSLRVPLKIFYTISACIMIRPCRTVVDNVDVVSTVCTVMENKYVDLQFLYSPVQLLQVLYLWHHTWRRVLC